MTKPRPVPDTPPRSTPHRSSRRCHRDSWFVETPIRRNNLPPDTRPVTFSQPSRVGWRHEGSQAWHISEIRGRALSRTGYHAETPPTAPPAVPDSQSQSPARLRHVVDQPQTPCRKFRHPPSREPCGLLAHASRLRPSVIPERP